MQLKLSYGFSVQKRSRQWQLEIHKLHLLSVQHKNIEFMEHFENLGSNISREDDADYDIYKWIGKASSLRRHLGPVCR